MADSFHFSVNIISRGKGKSAVASAAYISGEKIKNEWDGVTHDYTRKEKILVKNIILPDHIPKEFNDRSTLWNKVEMAEKNSNAQLARQFIIGLPKELSLSENKNLVERYIKENLTSQGMIVDYAIHDESQDKNGNIHCHIMTIMRPINEKGEFLAKSKKEYILDEKGEKVLNKNGKPKTRKVELTTWNDTGNVEKWRENFSDLCNKYLERAGAEKRVDHRSFKRQNSDYLPTIHLGSAASAMERKGIETDKGNYNREIRKKMNETLEKANGNLKSLMGDEMKIKDLYKKGQLENISIDQIDLKDLKKELNKLGVSFSVMKNKESKNYEIFFQAKDIKVMEYAFKQVIAKENKKEKVKPNKKDMTREI
ncbi:TPA: MobQ family relaxase [Streptococcus pneumoniae]